MHSPDVDDDFDTDEGLAERDTEYERIAAAAEAAGVPRRRSGRQGVADATATAAIAAALWRAPLPTDRPA